MKTEKTVLLILASLTLAIFGASDAFALTALKQVQVSNGSQVDLLFDGKVSRNQIKTEFFNDIIQLSLNDVSVYPAKISSVNGGNLTKIFAYQYAPRLVRCRLSVKGKAEDYRNHLVVETSGPNGRMLTVRLGGAVVAKASAPVVKAEQKSGSSSAQNPEEQALLERVMKSAAPQPAVVEQTDRIVEKAAAPAAVPPGNYGEDKPLNLDHNDSRTLGGVKSNIPSPLGVFAKLILVVAVFGALALAAKKFWKGKGENKNAIFGAIGDFARNSLGVKGLGSKAAIEILANHHLGPKRSIAVVKVGGRTLVVGITEQSINLIAQLSSEEDAMNAWVELDNPPLEDQGPLLNTKGTGATVAGPAVFSKVLQGETTKPAMGTPVANTKAAQTTVTRPQPKADVRVTAYGQNPGMTGNSKVATASSTVSAQAAMGLSGVRAQIKSKLEGLKQI